MTPPRITTVLLDVDGTLVDSNDAHADAWVEAFAAHGVNVARDDVRRAIGMGGDHLMPTVSGIGEESERGRRIAKDRKEIFRAKYLPQVTALRHADALVAELERRGFTLVAASSAKKEELRELLRIAGVEHLLDAQTSNDDAESSKPDPDIIHAALQRARAAAPQAVMIGDTPYDVAAAGKAGVPVIAFRSGGWDDEGLRGAAAIYDGPWDLLERLDESPLAARLTSRFA